MTWSEEVQASRTQQALQQAREDARLRRKGFKPEVSKDADFKPFLGLLSAIAGTLIWRQEGHRLKGVDWKELPVLKQLYALLTDDTQARVKRPSASRKKVGAQ